MNVQTLRPESGSNPADPSKRNHGMVILITIAFLIVGGVLATVFADKPGGLQIIAMVAYTFLVPYIASNRFLNLVPWDRLIRGKVLLGHCLALVIVYGITTEGLAIKPRLPAWLITSGRRPSLFNICLLGILLALAFGEFYWATSPDGE
jgi:hypothetical protein